MLDKLWSIQEPEIIERKIEFQELEEIHILLKELIKQNEVIRTEEFWDITLYSINSILWRWSNSSSSFNQEDSYVDGNIEQLEIQVSLSKEFEYLSTSILETILDRINKLRLRDISPLFDAELEHLDKKRKICFIANSDSFNFLVAKTRSISAKWTVKMPNELRKDNTFDEIVFFGQFKNLFYGKFSDPTLEFIFTSSRAEKIYWVHYSWISSKWNPKIFLIGSDNSTKPFNGSVDIFKSTGTNSIVDLDFVPKLDEERYVKLINESINLESDSTDITTQTLVEAYCFLLAEKKEGKPLAAFVSTDGSKALAISDFDGDGTLDIWKFLPEDLGKGMYILRRTQGAGRDVIEMLADKHLGPYFSSELRKSQKKWKYALSDRVNSIGLEESIKKLKAKGCHTANRGNLLRWMSEGSIRTRKESHFYALMEFSNLKKEARQIWQDMKRITVAHSQAGFELDALLKNKIEDINADTFYGNTSFEFTLSDEQNLGTMTAFAIEERLESTLHVPSGWTSWGVRQLT